MKGNTHSEDIKHFESFWKWRDIFWRWNYNSSVKTKKKDGKLKNKMNKEVQISHQMEINKVESLWLQWPKKIESMWNVGIVQRFRFILFTTVIFLNCLIVLSLKHNICFHQGKENKNNCKNTSAVRSGENDAL